MVASEFGNTYPHQHVEKYRKLLPGNLAPSHLAGMLNPYENYEGKVVEALVIGDWCAVRRRGLLHVVNSQTLLIGGDVVPVWTILEIRRAVGCNSAYADPDPMEVASWI